ncbi:MAG: hypothetical protein U1A27_05270 [Phycisphaerae bacterium]
MSLCLNPIGVFSELFGIDATNFFLLALFPLNSALLFGTALFLSIVNCFIPITI